MKKERINKYLACRGIGSRRKADQMVAEGRIRLNGKLVTELGLLVDPRSDRVEVDGKPVPEVEALSYLVVNKPAGVVTTVSDPEGRRTVLDLIPGRIARLYPVGRLDYDTEGLLFLMNDGRLAFRLTHPRYEVEKTYEAWLDAVPSDEALDRLRQGIDLEDGRTAPARVELLETRDPGELLKALAPVDLREAGGPRVWITIHEGKNRQVRRMLEAVGRKVVALKRVRFGTILLGDLKPGEWRKMTSAEIRELKKLVRLPN